MLFMQLFSEYALFPTPLFFFLELSVVWSSWERNHVAYVLHTSYEEYESFETESEASMRARAVAASVEIPLHILHRYVSALYLSKQFLVAFLTH